jgi:subtilisin family serine protease
MVMMTMNRRRVSVATAVTGLMAFAVLSLAGGSVQAEPAARSVARLIPGPGEWWLSDWQVQLKVWPLAQGSGVTVAVLDSGVQASIPDLHGVVVPGLDLTGRGTRGEVDFDYSADGHGTAVSALIAGQGHGTGTVGIAPEARILPVALPYTPGSDSNVTGAEVAKAVRFAVENGAQVIDMSFGGPGMSASTCDPVEQDAFAYALKRNVVLIASSGDTLVSGTGPINPALCAGVLAVAAVDPNGSLWPYDDRQPYVAVAAPGDHMVYVGRDERFTMEGAGTSLSAALVSGAAALIRSRYPYMSWYQVDQRLMDTALAEGSPVPNDAYGYGIVDLARAVNASAYPVSAAAPNPVYAKFKAWLATPAGRAFAEQNGTASPSPRPASVTRPAQAGTSAARQAGGSSSAAGRVVLVAVAVAAVGAFTVLQVMARSRRRRPPSSRGHRSLDASDWRTLPPRYQTEARDDEAPSGNQESHRPDWRYGYPTGYDPGVGPEWSARDGAPRDWRSWQGPR